jgi:hypothetical protein
MATICHGKLFRRVLSLFAQRIDYLVDFADHTFDKKLITQKVI